MGRRDQVTAHLLQDWRRNRRHGERDKTRTVKLPVSMMEQVKDHCASTDIAQGRFIEEVLRWYLTVQVRGGIYEGTHRDDEEPFETSSLGLGSTLDPHRSLRLRDL